MLGRVRHPKHTRHAARTTRKHAQNRISVESVPSPSALQRLSRMIRRTILRRISNCMNGRTTGVSSSFAAGRHVVGSSPTSTRRAALNASRSSIRYNVSWPVTIRLGPHRNSRSRFSEPGAIPICADASRGVTTRRSGNATRVEVTGATDTISSQGHAQRARRSPDCRLIS